MNLLFFMADGSDAVGYHRLLNPSRCYLGDHQIARRTKTLTAEDLDWADVLIISRLLDGKANEILFACRKYGVKIIVDVDDYWHLPVNHVLHGFYVKAGYAKKQEAYLGIADQVWVTNERLKKEVMPFNGKVRVIPNALPFGEDQFTDERTESERVRFFYAGGPTHRHDIALLSDVNRTMRKDVDFRREGQFVLAGFTTDHTDQYATGIWEQMERDYSGYAANKPTYKRLYGKTALDYMELYREADVGLIPLKQNRFTVCKSNLKLLECAAKKIPVIVSDIENYHQNEPPVKFCKSEVDFVNEIRKFLKSFELRHTYGEWLYEWAQENHNLHKINELREQAIDELYEKPKAKSLIIQP